MFPLNQNITPAIESHLQSQMSFFNDLSKTLFQSVQQISELNLQLVQSYVADAAQFGKDVAAAQKPGEVMAAAAGQALPAAEKLRLYRQNLARISAEAQSKLAECAEQHVPETSKSARAVADEVVKVTIDETEKSLQRQQDALQTASDNAAEAARSGARTFRDAANAGANAASGAANSAAGAANAAAGAAQNSQNRAQSDAQNTVRNAAQAAAAQAAKGGGAQPPKGA
jgi:phasin family protein